MSRAKWSAMDWYKISQFFQALGAFLVFVAPLLLPHITLTGISPSTAVMMGASCYLIVIIHRLEALLEQISHIDFERFLSRETED
jgi:hypothetical protein